MKAEGCRRQPLRLSSSRGSFPVSVPQLSGGNLQQECSSCGPDTKVLFLHGTVFIFRGPAAEKNSGSESCPSPTKTRVRLGAGAAANAITQSASKPPSAKSRAGSTASSTSSRAGSKLKLKSAAKRSALLTRPWCGSTEPPDGVLFLRRSSFVLVNACVAASCLRLSLPTH